MKEPEMEFAKTKARKILRLHLHPEAIKQNIANMKSLLGENEESVRFLVEDIETLVNWALEKLPLVPPPDEKGEPIS